METHTYTLYAYRYKSNGELSGYLTHRYKISNSELYAWLFDMPLNAHDLSLVAARAGIAEDKLCPVKLTITEEPLV